MLLKIAINMSKLFRFVIKLFYDKNISSKLPVALLNDLQTDSKFTIHGFFEGEKHFPQRKFC